MTRTTYTIWTAILIVLLLLTFPHLLHMLGVIFVPRSISVMRQLTVFQWAAAGIALYTAIYQILKHSRSTLFNNLLWFETFTHELTHTIVAIMLLREVHSFHTEKSSGFITSSGRVDWLRPIVSLAPYCLPIYTYPLLALRSLMDFHGLWIFDIIIGMTIAFHAVNFWKDTNSRQTDINQFPLKFSYLYIPTALCINLVIIWVAFFPHYNVFTSFWRLVCAQWNAILALFQWIFFHPS